MELHFDKSEYISIHAPPRGATRRRLGSAGQLYFNSRPSARGDFAVLMGCVSVMLFQFTPLREGRPSPMHQPYTSSAHFNSRPSARGDTSAGRKFTRQRISIHAPPRGATFKFRKEKNNEHISIHAPPRGATPRPAGYLSNLLISIHAPPRGATSEKVRNSKECDDFNSRPSARGDGYPPRSVAVACDFNSRPSARGDQIRRHTRLLLRNFNSRPSARGDQSSSAYRGRPLFQFTPLREGRPAWRVWMNYYPTFQFTPLREGRRPLVESTRGLMNFNSRPSARGD